VSEPADDIVSYDSGIADYSIFNPQAGGPPLISCLRLLIQKIRYDKC
jgi:hypothetical protein